MFTVSVSSPDTYYYNKHTESIAKAIQVPHRSKQIQICNSLKKLLDSDKSESVPIEFEACYQLALGYVKG